MAIKIDPPKGGQALGQGRVAADSEAPAPARQPAGKARSAATPPPPKIEAMEKPAALANPGPVISRPVIGPRDKGGPPFQQKVQKLKSELRAGSAQRLTAAGRAMVLAASYALRRSKGSRRHGLDLLEQISEEVEEVAPSAKMLRQVLLAEADLHQVTPEATLRAIRDLVVMLEKKREQE